MQPTTREINRALQVARGIPIDDPPPPPEKTHSVCPECGARFELLHPVHAELHVWCDSCWHRVDFDRDAAVAAVIPREQERLRLLENSTPEPTAVSV